MSYDVIVAGMGIHGLMTSFMLARRGLKVAIVDPYEIPHTKGSSHGRTRVHRRAYFEAPFYVPLLSRADEIWDQLTLDWEFAVLKRTGVLVIGLDDGRMTGGSVASARQHAITVELLNARETMARWPGLNVPADNMAVYEPDGGVLQVEHVLQRLRRLIAELGVDCITGRSVVDWDSDFDGVRVRLDGEKSWMRSERLILATGAWLTQVSKLKLPLKTERQVQVMFETDPGGSYGATQFPAIAIERGSEPMIYGIPDFGKGFKLAFHHGGRTGELESFEAPSKFEIERLHEAAQSWLPDIRPRALNAWTCIYTNTPDEHFIIDHHPKSDRVLVLSCCSGHGYKFAPVIGEIAAQLITDGSTKFDISMFGIKRFRQV